MTAQLDAHDWLVGLLAAVGSASRGTKWQCPAHGLTGEHSPSLAIRRGTAGNVVLHCHAGCGWRDVLAALNCPPSRLYRPATTPPSKYARTMLPGMTFPPPRDDRGDGSTGWIAVRIDEHPYGDPTTWAWKIRERNAAGAKRMHWESLNPNGERVPGLLGRSERDMPLYRIREVRMAIACDELIVLCESESSTDALSKAGIYATTWAGGASSAPLDRIAHELAHARVLLVPDHDDAGLACAERIITALPDARVQLGEPGEDARDILARCGPGWFR